MTPTERIAAIDIGSDTIHLLVGFVSASEDGPVVTSVQQGNQLLLLGGRVS